MIHRISVVVAAAAGLVLVPALSHVHTTPTVGGTVVGQGVTSLDAPTATLGIRTVKLVAQTTADGEHSNSEGLGEKGFDPLGWTQPADTGAQVHHHMTSGDATCPSATFTAEMPATDLSIKSRHPGATTCTRNVPAATDGNQPGRTGEGNQTYQLNVANQTDQLNQAGPGNQERQDNQAYQLEQDGQGNQTYQLNLANQTNQLNQAGPDGNQANQLNQAGPDGNQANLTNLLNMVSQDGPGSPDQADQPS